MIHSIRLACARQLSVCALMRVHGKLCTVLARFSSSILLIACAPTFLTQERTLLLFTASTYFIEIQLEYRTDPIEYFVDLSSCIPKMANAGDCESDDDDSTEGDLDLLKEKLAAIQAMAERQLQANQPTAKFECPLTSSDDDSSVESSALTTTGAGSDESFEKNFSSSCGLRRNEKVEVEFSSSDEKHTTTLGEAHSVPPSLPHAPSKAKNSSTVSAVQAPSPKPPEPNILDTVRFDPVVDRKMPPKQSSTPDSNSSTDSGSSSSTSSSSSSSSTSTSSSSSSDSDLSDDASSTGGSKGGDHARPREQTKQSPDRRVAASSRANNHLVTNPYVVAASRKPVEQQILQKPPPVETIPVVKGLPRDPPAAPAEARTPTPTPAQAPVAQDPALDLNDYLLFFGDDDSGDDDIQDVASPHFAQSKPPVEATGSKTVTVPPSGSSGISSNLTVPTETSPEPEGSSTPEYTTGPLDSTSTVNRTPVTQKGAVTTQGNENCTGRSSRAEDPLPVYDQTEQAPDQNLAEVHFSLYSPPVYEPRRQPIIGHKFSQTNRPKASRREIPVSQLFQPPISMLWHGRFQRFNALQSELAGPICQSDDNIIVSAPTGAGKTALFEMAMARFIAADLANGQYSHGTQRLSKHRKMVYFAPSKALCVERLHDWTKRLAMLNLGIEVTMITGDTEDPGTCYQDLASAHLILTTPEKWDSISRKWTENFFLMASVKLFMIDEVHLLGDGSRGHTLEAIIARTKSIQRAALNIKASEEQILSSR
jgi:hypothetical protein